jgi:hypothetical protein
MPTTTPVNGWPVPVSTDLVKDGAVAIEALGDAIDASANKTWQAWTTFTPSFTGLNIGSTGTTSAAYVLVGKTLHIRCLVTLGGTGISVSPGFYLTLPNSFSAKSPAPAPLWMIDTGTQFYTGIVYASTTVIAFYVNNASSTYGFVSGISGTVPMTWVATDQFLFSMSFEVA